MQWSVKRKLAAGFGGIVILVAISGAISYINVQHLIAHQNSTRARSEIIRNTYDLYANTNYGNSTIRTFYISMHDPVQGPRVKKNLESTWDMVSKLAQVLNDRKQYLQTEKHRKLVADLVEDAAAWRTEQADWVRRLETSPEEEPRMLEAIKKNAFTGSVRVRGHVAELLTDLNKISAEGDSSAAASGQTAVWMTLASAGLVIVLGMGLVFVLTRSIANPLHEAASKIAEAEKQDDLTVQVATTSNDEVGEICRAFNGFVQKLQTALGQAAASSEHLAKSAVDLSGTADGIYEEASGISTLIKQTADNASQTHQRMKNTRAVVASANNSMLTLSEASKTAAEASAEAQKVVRTIDEIAFQTNILALNAAVEAARAGEAGMGFSVVADEVRNLAQRAAQAAKDTSNLIVEIVSKTENGKTLAEATRGSFSEVAKLTSEVESFVAEITRSSQDQAARIGKIHERTSEMGEISKANAARVEELSASLGSFHVTKTRGF